MTFDEAIEEYRMRSNELLIVEELMETFRRWKFAFDRNSTYTGSRKDLAKRMSERAFSDYETVVNEASDHFGIDSERLKSQVRKLFVESKK